MKKRLFTMLLLLCLLLTALTATVAAESTNANGGHLEFTFNGRTVTFVLSFNYVCKNKHNTHDGYFTYNLNSVQAKKADGTLVSMAEWKPEDTICADITVSGIHCYVCDEKIDGTITKTVEFTGADVANFCHLTRNSNNALTAEMQHIRGADTNDRIKFKFYCYLYPFYPLEHHEAGVPTCEEDGYDTDWYRCPLCGKSFSNSNGTGEITVKPRLGHDFDENGVCTRDNYHAEAYIYSSLTKEKTYYDTAANAISKAKAPAESVHVVSYTRNDPITINKIVYLTVANGVTVPEIRMESSSDGSTVGSSVKIDNYGTVKLFSSAATVPSRYPGVSYTNHNVTERITAASTIAVQVMQISNKGSGTIGEINIPQTDNPTPKVQVTNNGGKIERLTGSPKNVELRSGTGRYGTITTAAEGGSVDSLLNKGCYFYFPNGGQKWVNSNAGKTVSDVIVSSAPFTVKVNRDGTALTASNGSYTVDNVTVGSTVALGVDFTPNEYGLTVDESKITSRWYYKNESKTAADGKALTLNNIQYGVYDLIFEAKESTYGFTTSISVTVNVNPPEEKTAISLKTQLTSDEYTKVYDGTTKASEILPPIEFQLADEREIRIPADCYTFKAEYASPDCITDNKIIVEVTLTEEGEKYYTLTDSKIEVPATITPYDGEWYDGVQHYKAFFVGLSDAGYDGSASIGRNVLPYLQLKGNMYDAVKGRLAERNITPEDGFQYSFYHLRPGSDTPDPDLDELLTEDSVFTYSGEYRFYAVVEPSLNYKECITGHTYFTVRDNYSGAHAHDQKTYAAWDGGSLSIAAGGTAARYLSNAQPNVNAELVLGQNKTLDLCLYNKAVHVIGSSYDQIYLAGGSTLVLSDCTKTGRIIGSKVKSGSGGVAYVKNGTFSIYDVTLTGGSASTGGAIVVDKDGTLNLYSGEISGNTVTSGKGGAIYIKSGGVVNIYGGTIKDNHVYSGSGGAIYVEDGGTLNLYGGTITGNTASGLGGGIYVEAGGRVNIQGAPVVTGNTAGGKPNNVYVCVDSTSPLLTISGELTDGAKLGVSTDASYPVLLAGSTQDYSAYFTPDDPDAFVLFSGSALTLCAKPSATLEGDTLTVSTGSNYKSDAFVLFVAEYGADGRLLAVHSEKITAESGTYTFKVQPGATIKCFLLHADTYAPLFAAFSPKA
ncbi:MAG: right-handed parallel beta-helix repeat-containing protein [Oscillospiraceae bacterium]|nr:right-handed parallel beta-helix repeat-containing protein [Oscillospiraceae bacterium]